MSAWIALGGACGLGLGARGGRRRAALALACALLAGCAEQRLHDNSQDLFRDGNYEAAVDALDAGARAYPNNAQLVADAIQARRQAMMLLVNEADAARREQRFDDAQAALLRARKFDGAGKRVEALIAELAVERRQVEAITKAEELVKTEDFQGASRLVAAALKDNPRQQQLLAEQRRIEQLARQAHPRGYAHLKETRPISLDFRDASLRTVLDAVTRNSGVNFVLDKDLRADSRVTIFLHGASVEDAIDLITSTNQLARKMVDEQTMLIYPNTPDKQRDYQEQVVRVFYLTSTEAKGAAAFLKSMLKLRDPFVDERANMLALRDTPENVELAERLLSLYDTADPEVTLELEVLEISSSRLTELGLALPNSVSLTPLPPNGATALTLGNIRNMTRGDIGLGIGAAKLNLRREVGDTKTLANPSIRVRSKEKAKVMIGDKVPVITTTTGQAGFVSDSVSYLDVGLQLEVEPTVFADDDVAIKLGLEVSSVTGQVKSGNGTLAYQIGTRNANTFLRLHDGETQFLAGLISHDEQMTATRLPGLGDLPLVGRLFSSQLDNGTHSELVLAVTPHVVRNVRRPEANEAELWVGTESAPRLRTVVNRSAPAASASAGPQSAASGSQVSPVLPALPGPSGPAVGAQANPPPTLRLQAPASAKVGEIVRVTIELDSSVGLRGLPLQMSFSKEELALVVVEEGGYFSKDGEKTSFTQSVQAGDGVARVGVLRNGATAASGKGTVYTLQFKALKPGAATLAITSVNAISLGNDVVVSTPAPLVLTVH
jgi:general secretion pathway protein D